MTEKVISPRLLSIHHRACIQVTHFSKELYEVTTNGLRALKQSSQRLDTRGKAVVSSFGPHYRPHYRPTKNPFLPSPFVLLRAFSLQQRFPRWALLASFSPNGRRVAIHPRFSQRIAANVQRLVVSSHHGIAFVFFRSGSW